MSRSPLLSALLLLALLPLTAQAAETYLGVYSEVSADPPGLKIEVLRDTPAAQAGLRSGDVITGINGVPLADSDVPFPQQLTEATAGKQIGDVVNFTVYRDAPQIVLTRGGEVVATDFPVEDLPELIAKADPGVAIELRALKEPQTLEIAVALGVRPDTKGTPFPPNDQLACAVEDTHPEVRELLNQLIAQRGIGADCADLWRRLDERATPDDGYKLSRVVYLLRDGLKGEAVTRAITNHLAGSLAQGVDGYYGAQVYAGELLDVSGLYAAAPALRTGLSAEEHLDVLQLILETAAVYVRGAFAAFTPEELEFIKSQREQLTTAFAQYTYIDREDVDPRRAQANVRLIELARKIDYEQLLLAQLTLAQLAEANYLAGLKADLTREFADRLNEGDLLTRDTPLGQLVISGCGHVWRQPSATHLALLIDLGGDDFYTDPAGSGSSLEYPVGVVLELGGDDAYESSLPYSQGSGSLGCGLLIDTTGDDQYVGLQWAQGCGFFGCGALLDLSGNDVYRGEELCQAAAIFGTGLLLDYAGDDRMEAQMKSQGFGGSRGIGLVLDGAGNDYRYAKGKYPTNYGDPGIFDSWSQGCAQGFRAIAAGGIAGIVDLGGSDYNEAGNFSQGGGYYFGFGFFHDLGWEGDRYLGSRYNQGFCAHEAVGVFLEEGGDDSYATRQAVAQGLAWDECSTMFIDYAGDDRYDGGGGFSQGASAHNALCVMWDRGGRDTYVYPAGQARAGGNDYHGGTSLSLFIDEGGAEDLYDCLQSQNNLVTGWPEHGFFVDLPASLPSALADLDWRKLWKSVP